MIILVALLAAFFASPAPQGAASPGATGDAKFSAGDYDGALADYQHALAAVDPEQPAAAGISLKIAKVLALKGDYSGSQALAARAQHIYEKTKGPDDASVALALSSVGSAMAGAGEYTAAIPVITRSLALARKTMGAEDRATLEIQEELAHNLSQIGEFAKAKTLEQETLAICERRFGEQDALTAQALRVLSQMETEMGDYSSAHRYQLRSLAILEAKAGADAVAVGDVLVTMGNEAHGAAEYSRAAGYFTRAAAIYEKRLGPHNTRLGGALDDLGQSLIPLRRFDEARTDLDRALAIQTQELGATHPWTANVLQSMGKLEAAAGNYPKARELLEKNLALWREKLGPAHPFTVVSMSLLSDVLAHLGQYSDALTTALDAARISREDILLTVRTVDEREALRYAERHAVSMDSALSIASRAQTGSADRIKVWDALIQSRALVLDEMGARHRSVVQSKDPAMAELAQRVSGARSQIARLVLQGPGKSPVAEFSAKVETSRAGLAQAEAELALKSAEFRRELDQRRTGYEEVRKALPTGSALVAFRRYRRRNYAAAGGPDTESYLAFVLAGPEQEPSIVNLGPAAQVEQLVAKWRAEIDREPQSLGRAAQSNEAKYRVAAAALRTAVWDPVARRLGGARRVYIVPDGALQIVNFAALPAPSSSNAYLLETGPLLHLLSAERDLALPAIPAASAAVGTELLVVAGPAFDAKHPDASARANAAPAYRGAPSQCGDFASLKFANLPGSLAEMRTIEQIWTSRGWHDVSLSGSAATEAAVKRAMPGKRVLHLATHGFFLDAQCPQTSVARENPLLRSGLALAGANLRQSAGPGEDDGILTAEEAASLNLEGTEWVVLSGCDTGLGDIKAGEGVLGLRRAFQEAGARTLINSLWPVGDEESQQWMATLYRARFVARKATAEAIRDADLEQLRTRRRAGKSTHPFYWAAFVAVGDWR